MIKYRISQPAVVRRWNSSRAMCCRASQLWTINEIMRKPVIAGNWKMYKLLAEAVDTALALKPLVANANHCEVVIAPVFTALKTVAARLEGSNIGVAAQNCSAESQEGAHTGEVTPSMLR